MNIQIICWQYIGSTFMESSLATEIKSLKNGPFLLIQCLDIYATEITLDMCKDVALKNVHCFAILKNKCSPDTGCAVSLLVTSQPESRLGTYLHSP